jgi:hypothetical protein
MNRANSLFKPSKISIPLYDEFIAAGKLHYAKAAGSDTFVLFGLQLGNGFQTWRRQADSRGDAIKTGSGRLTRPKLHSYATLT